MQLPSSADVVEWVRGTLLVPYRAALDPDDYAEFERRYAAELALAIGGESGERRPYFYGFDRILLWAAISAGGGVRIGRAADLRPERTDRPVVPLRAPRRWRSPARR